MSSSISAAMTDQPLEEASAESVPQRQAKGQSMIHHHCPQCGDDVMLSDGMSGQEYRCPTCDTVSELGPALPPPQTQQVQPPYPQQQVPPGPTSPYQQQPYSQHQAYGPSGPCSPPAVPRESAPGAVSSLVCGILSLVCCGIIFGIIAIAQANKAGDVIALNPGYYAGEGMATAGKILGIIGLVFGIIWTLIFVGNLACA